MINKKIENKKNNNTTNIKELQYMSQQNNTVDETNNKILKNPIKHVKYDEEIPHNKILKKTPLKHLKKIPERKFNMIDLCAGTGAFSYAFESTVPSSLIKGFSSTLSITPLHQPMR